MSLEIPPGILKKPLRYFWKGYWKILKINFWKNSKSLKKTGNIFEAVPGEVLEKKMLRIFRKKPSVDFLEEIL